MATEFDVVIKSPELGEGAYLHTVLAKLGGLYRVYQDIQSALLKPGARKVRLPSVVSEFTSFRVLGASKTKSLAVALQIPPVTADYQGDYAASLRRAEPTFVRTMIAAANSETDTIASMFTEKVDLVRVLNHIKMFAPQPGEPEQAIEGLIPKQDLLFHKQVREWVSEAMPSTLPEPIQMKGVIKVGRLGNTSAFQIFDGSRAVNVVPQSAYLGRFKSLFGQVVDVSAVAEYRPDGSIKQLVDVTEVRAYTYETSAIVFGDRRLTLGKPLIFKVETDEPGRQFIVTNAEFEIVAHGETLAEAVASAQEEFVVLWDSIGNAPIEELHESALVLRAMMRLMVTSDNSLS